MHFQKPTQSQKHNFSITSTLQLYIFVSIFFLNNWLYEHCTPNVIFIIICIAFIKMKQKKLCLIIFGIDADTHFFFKNMKNNREQLKKYHKQ